MFFGIGGMELIALVFIAIIVLGPNRMPEYAAKLARGIRQLRVMAEGAKGQLKEQLGPEYKDLDWRQYDPRQYDPRRIVKEALASPAPAPPRSSAPPPGPDQGSPRPAPAARPLKRSSVHDPALPTPFDVDAT